MVGIASSQPLLLDLNHTVILQEEDIFCQPQPSTHGCKVEHHLFTLIVFCCCLSQGLSGQENTLLIFLGHIRISPHQLTRILPAQHQRVEQLLPPHLLTNLLTPQLMTNLHPPPQLAVQQLLAQHLTPHQQKHPSNQQKKHMALQDRVMLLTTQVTLSSLFHLCPLTQSHPSNQQKKHLAMFSTLILYYCRRGSCS